MFALRLGQGPVDVPLIQEEVGRAEEQKGAHGGQQVQQNEREIHTLPSYIPKASRKM